MRTLQILRKLRLPVLIALTLMFVALAVVACRSGMNMIMKDTKPALAPKRTRPY